MFLTRTQALGKKTISRPTPFVAEPLYSKNALILTFKVLSMWEKKSWRWLSSLSETATAFVFAKRDLFSLQNRINRFILFSPQERINRFFLFFSSPMWVIRQIWIRRTPNFHAKVNVEAEEVEQNSKRFETESRLLTNQLILLLSLCILLLLVIDGVLRLRWKTNRTDSVERLMWNTCRDHWNLRQPLLIWSPTRLNWLLGKLI